MCNITAAVELNGRLDFIDDSVTVVFPPSNFPGEETINVFIPFIDDDTNEPLFEGFYVNVSIDALRSDPVDIANAELIRNGVALIRIEDDDSEYARYIIEHSYLITMNHVTTKAVLVVKIS